MDSDCSVFQGLGEPECGWDFELGHHEEEVSSSVPRIRNHTSGERPLVAHGCGGHGRWFLAEIYRKLHLLDYLGFQDADLDGLEHAGLVRPGCQVTEAHWVD